MNEQDELRARRIRMMVKNHDTDGMTAELERAGLPRVTTAQAPVTMLEIAAQLLWRSGNYEAHDHGLAGWNRAAARKLIDDAIGKVAQIPPNAPYWIETTILQGNGGDGKPLTPGITYELDQVFRIMRAAHNELMDMILFCDDNRSTLPPLPDDPSDPVYQAAIAACADLACAKASEIARLVMYTSLDAIPDMDGVAPTTPPSS